MPSSCPASSGCFVAARSRDFACRQAKQFALGAGRAAPLLARAVKVTGGFFVVCPSNVASERSRKLQLLKVRSWFDVSLVYVNQPRAIIAIEKVACQQSISLWISRNCELSAIKNYVLNWRLL
jgi:hypothetical protein